MIKFYPIEPMGAPRMTRADAWKRRPVVLRYRAFKDLVMAHKVQLQDGCDITFVLPMSASWSKKKKAEMDGQLHRLKPDLDNCLKGLMDAIYGEDCHIAHLGQLKKVWGYVGAIHVNEHGILR